MKSFNHNFYSSLLFLSNIFFTACDNSKINNQDLKYGLTFTNNKIEALVFAEGADDVILSIYEDCFSNSTIAKLSLIKEGKDNWKAILSDTLEGKSFSFTIIRNGKASKEVVDPYVKAVCANGNRGAFIDTDQISPENWPNDELIKRSKHEPIVLYELHVRDFSMDPGSGMKYKGKYLAFTEGGTKGNSNQLTGLDYIESLGITHIHLLPVFDFASIDETLDSPNYNWGYDPQNYFVPEGSYSTNPSNPESRIFEFKSMVKSIHDRRIGVIMDVVYNHTYYLDKSNFQEWAPGYYYRQNEDGSYSNASACGNELATEKEKVRQLIIESLKYWVEEYHIDGFRFDLMGIMDTETMNLISKELEAINPGVVLYGEGWLAGNSPLPDSLRAVKANMKMIPDYAAFSDEIRDGIKGHWSDEKDKGFVSGKPGLKPSVKFGIAGGIEHDQIDYSRVNNSNFAWAGSTWQCINYVSCHDNHTLIDKLKISSPESSAEELKNMHLLAQSIVLTSQGIPFLHAGTEFFRTKYGDHNSYESPDSINMIDWSLSAENPEAVQYIKDLISFRKENPAFWLETEEEVNNNLQFLDADNESGIFYQLKGGEENGFNNALFIFVGSDAEETIQLPEGDWTLRFEKFSKLTDEITKNGSLKIKGPNALILTN